MQRRPQGAAVAGELPCSALSACADGVADSQSFAGGDCGECGGGDGWGEE